MSPANEMYGNRSHLTCEVIDVFVLRSCGADRDRRSRDRHHLRFVMIDDTHDGVQERLKPIELHVCLVFGYDLCGEYFFVVVFRGILARIGAIERLRVRAETAHEWRAMRLTRI